PSTWIGSGGSSLCPGSGSSDAFRSLSGEKTGWTLIVSGRSTLYELPTFSRIQYGPAIWESNLQLGHSVFQFFMVTHTESPTLKSGSYQCLLACFSIDCWAFLMILRATLQACSKCLTYC